MKLNLPKREWAGFIVAVVLFVGSLAYAFTTSSHALGRLGEIRAQTDDLSSTVNRAAKVVIGADEARDIQLQFDELHARFSDAQKQGLIVSQLSQFARDKNLRVLEIKPTRPSGDAVPYPLYRISVEGEYRHLASYLDGLNSLRIPARAIGLNMWAPKTDSRADTPDLTADITVQAFIPLVSATEAGHG